MIKAFLVGISLIVGYCSLIFFSRYLDYYKSSTQKAQISNQQLMNSTQLSMNSSLSRANYNESHPVLKSLTRLIQIPFLGQFFMNDKIYQLAKLQNWEAIVSQTPYVVLTSANKYSFDVWYHKALAQCILGMIQQCQNSIKTAQLYAGNKQHRLFSKQLYKYMQTIKRGNTKSKFKLQL